MKGKQRKIPVSSLKVEFDREEDGRWIAEVPKLPGVMAYGATKREALQRVYAVALRTLADSVEQGNLFTPVSRFFRVGRGGPLRPRKFSEPFCAWGGISNDKKVHIGFLRSRDAQMLRLRSTIGRKSVRACLRVLN